MLSREKAVTAIFLTATIASVLFMVTGTANYTEFYRAVGQLEAKILSIDLSIEEKQVNLTLVFSVTNPTSYRGLEMREISYALQYEDHKAEISLVTDTLLFTSNPIVIDPFWSKTFECPKILNINSLPQIQKQATLRFIELHQTQQGRIEWVFDCTAILLTFVDTIDVPMTTRFQS